MEKEEKLDFWIERAREKGYDQVKWQQDFDFTLRKKPFTLKGKHSHARIRGFKIQNFFFF